MLLLVTLLPVIFLSYMKIPMKSSTMANMMKMVKLNFSGKKKLHKTAVKRLAVAELYSFTTLSSFLRMVATTSPPTLPKKRATTSNTFTLVAISARRAA